MPKFDFSVEETATSGTTSAFNIPDGWYVMKVVLMKSTTSNAGNQQVNLVWDVAEGEFANVAADNGWFESKHTMYLQLTGRSAGFTKRVLHVIADSNQGFESGRAFIADDFAAFVGKVFGARIQNGSHEYNGKTYRDMRIVEVADVSEAKMHDAPMPPLPTPPAQTGVADVYDEDIPF